MKSLTIGFFDGVHRGHQQIIETMKQNSDTSTVITFTNRPADVIHNSFTFSLSSLELKIALLKEYGIDEVISLPFTETIARMDYMTFVKEFPFDRLVVGEDFAFGHNRQGTAQILKSHSGFSVHIHSRLHDQKHFISSTRIRGLIKEGNLNDAEQLLGRPYCFMYHPQQKIDEKQLLPPDGDYFVYSETEMGKEEMALRIRNRTPFPEKNVFQLISFGSNTNPNLFKRLCQISPAELSVCQM